MEVWGRLHEMLSETAAASQQHRFRREWLLSFLEPGQAGAEQSAASFHSQPNTTRCYSCPHFVDESTEAQRKGLVTRRSHD